MAAEMKTKMLKLAVVNKMLTFKNCTNHSVEFFHLLDLKLGKKGKHVVYYRHVVWDMYMFFFMWCTLMLK